MFKLLKMLAGSAPALLLAAGGCLADDREVYRWTDEDGVVHYGDYVPPEYNKQTREIVNEQGVPVRTLPAEKTEAELAAERRAAEREKKQQHLAAVADQRDEVLLNTYLSVSEIEALRDRRLELIDGQIRVTEIYLRNLRDKLGKLQKEAERFRPYSPDADAPPIHDNLARELSDTLDSIILYEKNLDDARERQAYLEAKFATDIDRFRQLKTADRR